MTTRVPSTLARLAPAALLGVLLVLPAWFWWATTTASPAQVGIDFGDYWTAATRVAHGTSPYAPEMLAGPVDAMGTDRFRYPPPLAQVLVPLSLLGPPIGARMRAGGGVGALALGFWTLLRISDAIAQAGPGVAATALLLPCLGGLALGWATWRDR